MEGNYPYQSGQSLPPAPVLYRIKATLEVLQSQRYVAKSIDEHSPDGATEPFGIHLDQCQGLPHAPAAWGPIPIRDPVDMVCDATLLI
ncbi:hypothetical protein JTE90_011538 [Oedothorax gibbosus]|uniref:Uncharacterized protein n=1 Tax=Oedothorax gibbosus TaxID=931172 RepID=A0AAV6UKK3_9ARAC|nr:hypothetical protein JTE90_011538 [Oedothorax gibbosus]